MNYCYIAFVWAFLTLPFTDMFVSSKLIGQIDYFLYSQLSNLWAIGPSSNQPLPFVKPSAAFNEHCSVVSLLWRFFGVLMFG